MMGMSLAMRQNSKTEYELFSEYRRTHDTALRDEIVEKYIYMAEILSRRFINRGVEYDDIYQVACMGVLYAVERFDPDKGVKFPTFATPTVLGEIRRYFRDKGSFVRVPRRLYEVFYKAERIRRSRGGASRAEIARLLGLDEDTVEAAYKMGDAAFIKSLEDEAYADGAMSLANVIGAEDDNFLMIENKDFLRSCMESLSDTERRFVKLRYYDEMSQTAIAAEMGMTQMQVSRLERRLLKRFRDLYFKN
ncbi:MAG TPA: sigma-70 family RNA polymerase sigma factor [Candidatus Ornithomonoglobus intestinigallinarum]|uniref:Sigma-70 family RNA polymerase sigma factor n=1 Tax=Candidatus Ornithomonoglobus intestinigallinarum TaxID=2840894 RepID=A0A9D1H5L3_9FIRM|nr:sigma-70 family RNA polymerase sigma factor [Candidatus Ornithomonoglobus intestinigallinarum]